MYVNGAVMECRRLVCEERRLLSWSVKKLLSDGGLIACKLEVCVREDSVLSILTKI